MLEEKGAGRTKMRQTELTDIQTVGESERESERERERERERESESKEQSVFLSLHAANSYIDIVDSVAGTHTLAHDLYLSGYNDEV